MKYLSDYMNDKQTKLFEEKKCFFAFGKNQFEEGIEKHNLEKREIVSLDHGLYCLKENAKFVLDQLEKIYVDCIKLDLKENGKEKVIYRELSNHECFWTGNIDDCVNKLKDYSITEDEIIKIYYKYYQKESAKF
jgi:hypothetical protein